MACCKHKTMRCYSIVIGIVVDSFISLGFDTNTTKRTGARILDHLDPSASD